MIITEAKEFLEKKYSGTCCINEVKKNYSVVTADKNGGECCADSGLAAVLLVRAAYEADGEIYVISGELESNGTDIDDEELASTLSEFEREMAETEAKARESEDATAFFRALIDKECADKEGQIEEMERSVNRTLLTALFVSVGSFILLLLLILLLTLGK